jgi:4-hydroxybenzoate polyprenyltransferase
MHIPALLRAAHLGPTLAVTAVAGLLALGADLSPGTTVLVMLAVLTGQLVVGWSNDLIDVRRDASVHRCDKPLATGELSTRAVRFGLAVAGGLCVLFSLALGWWAGVSHLVPGVGSGLVYNAWLKSSRWSWLPYAVAFAVLPAVVTLAERPPVLPGWPVLLAGALLGVGAHLVNALPDLDEDAATGVHGLPHRLGAAATQLVATAVLVAASTVVVLGPPGPPGVPGWTALALTVALGAFALAGRGRTPFHAAIAIALVDVVLLATGGAA